MITPIFARINRKNGFKEMTIDQFGGILETV